MAKPVSADVPVPTLPAKSQAWHWYVEWMGNHAGHIHGVQTLLYSGKTAFQTVEIYKTHDFGKMLVLDGDPQSSEYDEDIYHEALVHPALVAHPAPKTVLILGGGEGATLREVLRHPDVRKVVMVDIDEMLVKLCEKELPEYSQGAFRDPRAEIIFDDAKAYIARTREKFDCVISDLTEPYSETPSDGLLSESFLRSVQAAMTPEGVFAMQASRASRGKDKLHLHHRRTAKKVWKTVRPYHLFIPSFYDDWGFLIASNQTDPRNLPAEQIDRRLRPFAEKLRFYDGAIHGALFSFSKELRCH